MAKRVFSVATWTPVAVADATNFTDGGYQAILGGSTTQIITYLEVFMSGQAGASAPTFMLLSRDSTVEATPTALTTGDSDAALDPATAALAAPPVAFHASTTKPQRSSTLHLLNLTINAFGGIVRWQPSPGCEPKSLGNTASLGEVSLSAFTGGTPGAIGSHIMYEPS